MIQISAAEAKRWGIVPAGRSKFNIDLSEAGKAARTYDGRIYDSQPEMRYAQQLDQRVRVRDIESWTPQVTIPLKVNGITVCRMICDFRVVHVDGAEELIEIKGAVTAVFRLKLRLLKALMPELKYTVIAAKDVR